MASVYGHISGQQLDRAAPGEAWTSLPFRPVFIGDTERGVLHGGVITAMLDESCGMAVELALDGTRAIATLDLRIDYQKPATAGLDVKAHSICTRVARSIAFVHSTAYQVSEDDPVATATACFMIGANRTNVLTDWPKEAFPVPTLEAPEDPASPFSYSPFARCLGIRLQNDGTWMMPFSPKIIGSPIAKRAMRSTDREKSPSGRGRICEKSGTAAGGGPARPPDALRSRQGRQARPDAGS